MKKQETAESVNSDIKRFSPDAEKGLTDIQVEQRKRQGLCNVNTNLPTKSIQKIFFDNIVTVFNILNIILGLAVFYVGSYKNMLFLGVMFFNTVIGIFQVIRAKRTIDKLSIVETERNVSCQLMK